MEMEARKKKGVEIFEVGPCENAYEMGFLIGQRFSEEIRSRLETDLILQKQLLPFATTLIGQHLLESLSDSNRKKFTSYWDELLGTAQGSSLPFLHVINPLHFTPLHSVFSIYLYINSVSWGFFSSPDFTAEFQKRDTSIYTKN